MWRFAMINKIRIQNYRIYKDLTLYPNPRLNMLVGSNESGKSTLLEAIVLSLTGRINGRWASDDLNPYWFNTDLVSEFVRDRRDGKPASWPEIRIELFFDESDDLHPLSGAINTDVPTNACPGITLAVIHNPEYVDDLEEWAKGATLLLPVEYYMIDWRTFADQAITSRLRLLSPAVIDSRTIRSSSGVDYYMRHTLSNQLEPAERAAVSLAYRDIKSSMSDTALKAVNERMAEVHASLYDRPISLAMDQSTRTSWESAVTPHVGSLPFSMSGQGQQAAIKVSLAMNRNSDRAPFVMVEEPENHMTHTSLAALLTRIESLAGEHQQLFITTHSSFVLNRLGLDALQLLEAGEPTQLSGLSKETVRYFQKLPGYDTLRMVLAEKVVLVEGPSDEIIFERIFKDLFGLRPLELRIDVLSMRGLSFSRCLELCTALDKPVAAIRDNDGVDPNLLRAPLQEWLVTDKREIFIGSLDGGPTLEPQIVHHNGEDKLRAMLGITERADLAKWMGREKTEGALRLACTEEPIEPPTYMREAAEFIHG